MVRRALLLLLALLALPAAAYDKAYIDGIGRRLADPSPDVRAEAARDANNAGEQAAAVAPLLVELIRREPDKEVRSRAVMALARTGKASAEAPAALAAVLRRDPEEAVRLQAATALRELGTGAEQAVPALIAALDDPARDVRRRAAGALAAYPAQAASSVPAIVDRLDDGFVAVGGLFALGQFGPAATPAVPALRRLLGKPALEDHLRRSTLTTLARIGPGAAEAAPECLGMLEHRDPTTRVAAAGALLAFDRHAEAAYKALVEALSINQGRSDHASREQRSDVVVDAAEILARHGGGAGGDALAALAAATIEPVGGDMRNAAAKAFDEVLAAIVKAKRIDAIDSLRRTERFLAASQDELNRARGLRVAAAIDDLERMQPAGARLLRVAAPAAALAAVAAVAGLWWRRRRRSVPQVFISYRRQDTAATCGRLYDHLIADLGPGRVFRDIDSIAPGTPFAQRLQEAIAACDAFIVLIGPAWLTLADEAGRRRLDDPQDFVRLEIEAALAAGRPVFPVLVEGTGMPAPEQLPASLAPLTQSHALELGDRHFAGDVRRLAAAIRAARRR